jgi:hypothetical protein
MQGWQRELYCMTASSSDLGSIVKADSTRGENDDQIMHVRMRVSSDACSQKWIWIAIRWDQEDLSDRLTRRI